MNRRGHAGPFVPDLESILLHNLERQRAADPLEEIWVLVPGLHVRRRLRKRLADGDGCFNIRFVIFPDLAREVVSVSPDRADLIPLDRSASRLILQGVVARNLARKSYFGDVRARGGFIEALESTLDDLDDAGIEPRVIRDLSRSGKPGISPGKLAELAGIQESWKAAMRATGYESRAGLIWRAVERASNFPARALHVYGFYDLNGAQRRLIEALSADSAGREVTFYFPLVATEDAGYSRPLRRWLDEHGFTFEEASAGAGAGGAPAAATPPVSPESTDLFSAAGERRESEEAARRVLKLLGAGTRPDEIAIVYRKADPYAAMLASVLERAGIPATVHDRSPVSERRPARVLKLFVRAARSGHARRDVMNFFDIALPMHPVHGARSVATSSAWDALTIDAGITGGRGAASRDEWFSRLRLLAETREGYLRRESRAVAGFVPALEELFAAFDRFTAAANWRDFTTRLIESATPWITPGPERDHLFEKVDALGDLDRTGETATPEAFEAALGDLLDRTPLPARRERRAAVHVGDVLSVRGLAFTHLFVLGLTEKVFPRAARPDPILLDRERELLAGPGGAEQAWLPLRGAAAAGETFLFALLRASAKHLTLSWSRVEPAKARPRLPSIFILRAASELRGAPVDYSGVESCSERVPLDLMAAASGLGAREPSRLEPPDDFAVRADSALDAAEFDRMIVALAAGSGDYPRLAGLCRTSPGLTRAITADVAQWGDRLTAYDGSIASASALEVLREMLPPDRIYSASQLERYATCPFCYFLERFLGVEAIESPEDQDGPDARRRGTLVHAILQEFLSRHTGAGLVAARREELRAELLALAGRHMDEFERREVTGVPLSWAINRNGMLDDLALWLDFELDRPDGLRPASLEWSFGPGLGDVSREPLRLRLPGGDEVALRGKIDRIDFSADGSQVRVIDYKTGRPPDHFSDDLDGGRKLQLPTYLLAIAQAFPKVKSGTAEYLHINDGVKAIGLKCSDFAPLRTKLSATVATLVEGIETGRFFPIPDRNGACRYCYQTICGAGIATRFERKKGDAWLEPLMKLRGDA